MKQPFPLTARLKQYFKTEFLTETAAASMLALGIAVFSAPNRIVGGGLSGIASVLYVLFTLPIGTTSFALNIPLFMLGWRALGSRFILRTLRVTLIVSLVMDAAAVLPAYSGERLLAALFAGAFSGAGLGIILMRGDSTGGTDIIVKLIQKKRPHLSLGRIVMLTDAAVILLAAAAYQNVDTVLYGIVMAASSSAMIDRIIYGSQERKLALIITRSGKAVTKSLLTGLNRGVTVIPATGGYSGGDLSVLLCVVENRQIFELKRLVYALDSGAFVIVATAAETLGTGFGSIGADVHK